MHTRRRTEAEPAAVPLLAHKQFPAEARRRPDLPRRYARFQGRQAGRFVVDRAAMNLLAVSCNSACTLGCPLVAMMTTEASIRAGLAALSRSRRIRTCRPGRTDEGYVGSRAMMPPRKQRGASSCGRRLYAGVGSALQSTRQAVLASKQSVNIPCHGHGSPGHGLQCHVVVAATAAIPTAMPSSASVSRPGKCSSSSATTSEAMAVQRGAGLFRVKVLELAVQPCCGRSWVCWAVGEGEPDDFYSAGRYSRAEGIARRCARLPPLPIGITAAIAEGLVSRYVRCCPLREPLTYTQTWCGSGDISV